MTRKQLDKFIKARNKSGLSTNLQFTIDAKEAGFSINKLGRATKTGHRSYSWNTPFGLLTEVNNYLELHAD